jgi:RNA polymerase sigma-70 factor (ECF subfamily)
LSDSPLAPGSEGRSERATSLTLLEKARGNEPGALERLVRLYQPLVHYWCCRGGVAYADADDVVQEVFQEVVADLSRFHWDRPGDTFRGWLRGITRHLVLLHLRRRGRHPRAAGGTDAFAKLQEMADPQVDLPDEDPPAEVQGLYRRALDLVRGEFEDRTWQMFWVVVIEDRSPAAVAEQFGVSAAAVRKAKSRVLHRLKEEVGDLVA